MKQKEKHKTWFQRFRAKLEALSPQPEPLYFPVVLISIHQNRAYESALRSTLNEYIATLRSPHLPVLVTVLPQQSYTDVVGYREMHFAEKLVSRVALREVKLDDGTMRIETYSPRLIAPTKVLNHYHHPYLFT